MKAESLALALVCGAGLSACQCASSGVLEVAVHVQGKGRVVLGATECATDCQVEVARSSPAVALADDGWRFAGWAGLCTGQGSCVVESAGELTAAFVESSVVVVTVSGPGTVLASDGRRCLSGECRWPTTSVITLMALPSAGAQFVGYSGACTGTATCALSDGAVHAAFRESGQLLNIEFLGTGAGVVRDITGDYTCNQSCSLRAPPGVELEFRGLPATGSVFGGFTGDCSGSTCRVTAPASVQARFDVGRRLVVTSQGSGGGIIEVDGVACAAPCDLVVAVDRPVTIEATPDETSRLVGFSGDCAGDACVLGPGDVDLAVNVQFSSVLQWVRSFPIPSGLGNNVALFADDAGIHVAASVRGSMVIDGTTYAEPFPNRNGSPYFIELGWDAGVQSVLPFYDYVDGGNTRTDVASLTKGPDGALFAFGVCFQGHFLGQPCGALNVGDGVPFVLEVLDGGVRAGELRTDLQAAQPVGFLDSHLVGSTVVARVFRHDQLPNGRSGFYVRQPGADAGTVTLAPDLISVGGPYARSWGECMVEGESLVCMSPVSGAFTGLGCPASTPGGGLATYRYTPSTAVCDLQWRIPSGQTAAVRGLARSPSGLLHFVGRNADGTYDFGSGFTLSGAYEWVGGLDGSVMNHLTSSPVAGLALSVGIAASNSGVLVLAKTGPLQPGPSGPFFGIPITVNDSAHVLTFDDTGRIIRKWPLLGGAANDYEIYNGAMARVGNDIVVAIIASGYTFRGQPLAPDLQKRLFVLVFRE